MRPLATLVIVAACTTTAVEAPVTEVPAAPAAPATESPEADDARARAAVEFDCPKAEVKLRALFGQRHGAETFEIDACGHQAIYTCLLRSIRDSGGVTHAFGGCIREPPRS